MEVGYERRWWQNFADVTDNLALSSADFDPFSIVAPSDPRLPNGGGYIESPACSIWTRPSWDQPNNIVRAADYYGGHTRYYDSVDLTVNARLEDGLTRAGRHQHGAAGQRHVRDPRAGAGVRRART